MKNYHVNRPPAPSRGGNNRLVRYAAAALFVVASAAMWPGLLERAGLGGVARAFNLGNEAVTIYSEDCKTPQATFFLGDTVCILVSDAPLPDNGAVYRQVQWASPNITEGQRTDILDVQHYERFWIPTSGPLAQLGKWAVQTIDNSANGYAVGNFVVRSREIAYVDFSVSKDGPLTIAPGSYLKYTITVRNNGPEVARDINFVDYMPSNTTFVALKQADGIPFECTTPERGTYGKSVCTGYKMLPDESATFVVYYEFDSRMREGTVFSSSTYVWGENEELNKLDNSCDVETTVQYPAEEVDPEPEP